MRKWCGLTIFLTLAGVGYVTSYPVARWLLVGRDERHFSPGVMGFVHYDHDRSWHQRYDAWCQLERYYYPPVRWMTDNTPLNYPMFVWSRMWDVDDAIMEKRTKFLDFTDADLVSTPN